MAPQSTKNSSSRSNTNYIAKNKLHRVQQRKPNLAYMLYKHREELRKSKPNFMFKAYSKLQLTHELITKTVQNPNASSPDDAYSICRGNVFKNKLKQQIARAKCYHKEKYQKQIKQLLKQYLPKQTQQKQRQSPHQHQMQPLTVQQNSNDASNFSDKVNKLKRKLF